MTNAPYEVLTSRYELHRQLANGGTADVFLARDQLLNRPVAVKVLSEELSSDDAFVERLRQEAQVVASLNHQNIVGVFDQGEHEGAPFIVMEYVDGRSLDSILRNEGKLDPDRAAMIAVDVAAALDAAHRQGMVHMDVKPGNVLITEDGQVKLADFGIAKALKDGSETDYTVEDGTVMGTATYLSPEQAQGRKVGPRSDVYSLAVVLYEMIAGQPPFTGESAVEIARKHVEQVPQSPRVFGVEVAQSLEAITFKGLAKDPDHRYPSVRDFAADLKRYLGGAHSTAKKQAAAPVIAPRPVTGRSTPPEIDETAVIPATPSRPQAPVATPQAAPFLPVGQQPQQPQQPQHQGAAAAGVATAAAGGALLATAGNGSEQQVAEDVQPIVVRSDDTWKRNILFFLALCILMVLLAFLAQALLDVLGQDPAEDVVTQPATAAETIELQDFSNFERDQAMDLIDRAGLIPEIQFEPNNDVGEGRVFRQNPVAGALVEPGSVVEITVSEAEGSVEIPPLIELTREEAEQRLTRLGFNPSVQEVDSNVASPGVVISQDPLPGTDAEPGSVVFIEVSLGPAERLVPDLAGRDFNEALDDLFELDFRTSRVDEADPEVEEGVVLRTEPEAGSLLRGREIVTIFVSSGVAKINVPSVEGLGVDSARQALIASGFEVLIEFIEVEDEADVNRVLASGQSPPANTELREGDPVTITVGLAPVEGEDGEGDGTTTPTTTAPDGDGGDQATTTTTTTVAPTTTTAAEPDTTDE